jgi:Phosphate-selective porin O and P
MDHLFALSGISRSGLAVNSTIARYGIVAAAAFGLFLGAAARAASPATQPSSTTQPSPAAPSNADLRQQIDVLNSKVEKLEANQQAAPSASGPQIHALFDEDVATSGYDPSLGFVLRSDDGDFSFHPGAVFEFRYEANFRDDIPKGGGGEAGGVGTDDESGFNMAKARFTADGNLTKPFTYYVQVEADQGTALTLLDAYGTYHIGDSPFSIRGGQFKDPVWHERNLSEATLLAVDRALVENLIGSGGSLSARVEGAALLYDQDRIRAQLVIHHGFDSANSKFYDAGGEGAGVIGSAGVTPMDFGTTGRAEYLVLGDRSADFNPFSEYDHGFTALHDKQQILVLGGGTDFSQAGANDLILSSVDLQYDHPIGFSAYGAFYNAYRDLKFNQGVTPGYFDDTGFEAQAGYLVTPKIEPFVRYDCSYLAAGSVAHGISRQVPELTGGVNYYLYNQNLKITIDGTWLPNGSPEDVDSEGILEDNDKSETVLRLQFQLAI